MRSSLVRESTILHSTQRIRAQSYEFYSCAQCPVIGVPQSGQWSDDLWYQLLSPTPCAPGGAKKYRRQGHWTLGMTVLLPHSPVSLHQPMRCDYYFFGTNKKNAFSSSTLDICMACYHKTVSDKAIILHITSTHHHLCEHWSSAKVLRSEATPETQHMLGLGKYDESEVLVMS